MRTTAAALASFIAGFLISGLVLASHTIAGDQRDIIFSALGFAVGFGFALIYKSRRR